MKNIYAEREGTTDVEIEKCNFAFYCAGGGIVSVGDCE